MLVLLVDIPAVKFCNSRQSCKHPIINMVLNKLLLDGSQAFVMNPKKDLYGLGFDPFKDAPEFRGRITIFLCFSLCVSEMEIRSTALESLQILCFLQNVSVLGKTTVLAMVAGKVMLYPSRNPAFSVQMVKLHPFRI